MLAANFKHGPSLLQRLIQYEGEVVHTSGSVSTVWGGSCPYIKDLYSMRGKLSLHQGVSVQYEGEIVLTSRSVSTVWGGSCPYIKECQYSMRGKLSLHQGVPIQYEGEIVLTSRSVGTVWGRSCPYIKDLYSMREKLSLHQRLIQYEGEVVLTSRSVSTVWGRSCLYNKDSYSMKKLSLHQVKECQYNIRGKFWHQGVSVQYEGEVALTSRTCTVWGEVVLTSRTHIVWGGICPYIKYSYSMRGKLSLHQGLVQYETGRLCSSLLFM